MASFKDKKEYIKEFSLRTMCNYSILSNDESLLNYYRAKMEYFGYGISGQFCRGTLLINSMYGLVIYPHEVFYAVRNTTEWKELTKESGGWFTEDGKNHNNVMQDLRNWVKCNNEDVYKNTYKGENECPRLENIFNHIRNSIAHPSRVQFEPEPDAENRNIEHIVMNDKDGEQEFRLKIDLDAYEHLLMATANYFIRFFEYFPSLEHLRTDKIKKAQAFVAQTAYNYWKVLGEVWDYQEDREKIKREIKINTKRMADNNIEILDSRDVFIVNSILGLLTMPHQESQFLREIKWNNNNGISLNFLKRLTIDGRGDYYWNNKSASQTRPGDILTKIRDCALHCGRGCAELKIENQRISKAIFDAHNAYRNPAEFYFSVGIDELFYVLEEVAKAFINRPSN